VIGAVVVAVTTAGSFATVAHETRTVPTKSPTPSTASAVAHRALDSRVFRVVKRSGAAKAAARSRRRDPIAAVDDAPANASSPSQPDVVQSTSPVETAAPAAKASPPEPNVEQIVASAASTVAAAAEPTPSVIETATNATGAALDTVSSGVDTATSTVGSVVPPQLPDVPLVTVTVTVPGAPLP
jgi:hypothetical protein